MADLTADELASIERSLGGPSRCAASNSETCRMVTELRRYRDGRARLRCLIRFAIEGAAEKAVDAALGEINRQVGRMGHVLMEARGNGIRYVRGVIASALAGRVIEEWISEDGGKLVADNPWPRATQQGAATPGQGATAQGAAQAAGNVAESQLGPTPDRAEHPPSSPFDPVRQAFLDGIELAETGDIARYGSWSAAADAYLSNLRGR